MALTASSPAARAEWLEKTALPKAQKAKVKRLTAEPMAELLGVSWVTLRKWTRDFPGFEASNAFEGGERGVQYSFKPVATVRFLIKHFSKEAEKRRQANRKVRTAIGGDVLGQSGDDSEDLSLDDLRKAIQVRSEMIKQQEREGTLMNAAVVTEAIDRMMSSMTEAGIRAAREQDPTGQLDQQVAEKIENAVESIMVSIQTAGQKCLDELRSRGSVS